MLNEIAFDCRNNDPELSISYGQNALELSEKLGYPKGIGEGYLAMGAGKINLGRHEEALNYLNHALKSFRFEKGKAVVEKKDGFIEMYTADYL